ncbi:MAG TPA: hypothetical protein VGK78_15840 [Nocardioides sp.]|uniref:DUF6907 domain-containing protein n=1 Tax=Nocardioides sp. TaxID=35761 RepID=UPI002F41448D
MAEPRNDKQPTPDECPGWCARRHLQEDHPEDRLHQSPPIHAVLMTGPSWLPHDAAHRASPVVARLVQHTDSSEAWLEVTSEEDGAVRLAVTPESGRRLVALLDSLLEMLRA